MSVVLVIKGGSQKHAASKDSATEYTATTPDQLKDGSVGIYGIQEKIGSTNDQKAVLIKDASSGETAGICPAVDYRGKAITICQGTASGVISSPSIQIKGVKKVKGVKFDPPVKAITHIGYTGSTGSLNLPTIVAKDEGMIKAVRKLQGANETETKNYNALNLPASETAYNILLELVGDFLTERNGIIDFVPEIVSNNSSVADWTGTGTALKFTNGSKTVAFVVQDATSGWVASTGTVAAGDIINIPHDDMTVVTFTADILGTGAGRHVVTINGTIYNVADAGTAAQNGQAIVDAINAGTQATATLATADVTITMKSGTSAKITVEKTADDASWSTITLTVTASQTQGSILKASAAVSAAASFELDSPYQGQTMYALGGTSAILNAGILSGSTTLGLRLTNKDFNKLFRFAVDGVLKDATITYTTPSTPGSGSSEHVLRMENVDAAYRGDVDQYSVMMKHVPRFTVDGTQYDVYFVQYVTTSNDTTGTKDVTEIPGFITVAFAKDADTAAFNQSDFEDILQALLETNSGAVAGTYVDAISA